MIGRRWGTPSDYKNVLIQKQLVELGLGKRRDLGTDPVIYIHDYALTCNCVVFILITCFYV